MGWRRKKWGRPATILAMSRTKARPPAVASPSSAELVTLRQAAQRLQLTPKGAAKLVERGVLVVVDRVGPVRRVRRSDVEAYAANRRSPGRPRKVSE